MGIQAQSVTAKAIRIKDPQANWVDPTGVTFSLANGQATFRLSRTFTNIDNGVWRIYSSPTDRVLDTAGNAVVADVLLGEFQVNIPAPVDTRPPTATFVSASPNMITTAGNTEVSIVISYADPA